jgi:adenylyl-sulfate kinase
MQPLLIDGDALREELCKDLDFSQESRSENIRRAGAIALIAARSGITSICALISPLQRERDLVRTMAESKGIRFVEVYVSTPLSVCEDRDTKGLYKKARAGMIPQFTGIDSPYEPPLHPEVELPTERFSVEECLALIEKSIAS